MQGDARECRWKHNKINFTAAANMQHFAAGGAIVGTYNGSEQSKQHLPTFLLFEV